MPGTFSDFLENKLLDAVFRNTSYTPGATLWIGLFTSNPNDAGGGTEVSGNNYSRVSVTVSTTFSAASAGATSNTAAITFPTASGSGWGTISAIGIFDANSAGNLLAHSTLTTTKTIAGGDTASFGIGDLSISLD